MHARTSRGADGLDRPTDDDGRPRQERSSAATSVATSRRSRTATTTSCSRDRSCTARCETQFTIGADRARRRDVTATGFDDKVASCVAGVIQNIEFPPVTGGSTIVVNYPFTFRTPETPGRGAGPGDRGASHNPRSPATAPRHRRRQNLPQRHRRRRLLRQRLQPAATPATVAVASPTPAAVRADATTRGVTGACDRGRHDAVVPCSRRTVRGRNRRRPARTEPDVRPSHRRARRQARDA